MSIKKSPCYKCEFRTVGCHSKCEPYKKWNKYQRDVKYFVHIQNNPPGCTYIKAKCTKNGVSPYKRKYR